MPRQLKPDNAPCVRCGSTERHSRNKHGWPGPCKRCNRERGDRWIALNRDKQKVYMDRMQRRRPWIALARSSQKRSAQNGVVWALTEDFVRRLLETPYCAYCDLRVEVRPGYAIGQRQMPHSATLDRVDPNVGYIPENVVLACYRCNSRKREHTPESLRALAERIEAITTQRQGVA